VPHRIGHLGTQERGAPGPQAVRIAHHVRSSSSAHASRPQHRPHLWTTAQVVDPR
jgi:hypothetical protein